MKNLLNKTFFKFATGFLGIIALAVVGVLLVGSYEYGEQNKASIEDER
ncbi:MAG: hypothetical protein BMS9Abin13_419 [Patescibacteria group bacterium]|nr:MAG: hypothetical protein BMS9Abin13_419 [Patescibacteria group bacterium]